LNNYCEQHGLRMCIVTKLFWSL